MNKKRLLVIDDEADVAEFIAEVGRQNNFDVKVTTAADAFRNAVRTFSPTTIVFDLQMPEVDGVEILRFLADERCTSRLILVSGMDANIRNATIHLGESLNLNMAGTLQKPVTLDMLEKILLENHEAEVDITREALEHAIKNNELVIYYQPKVDLRQLSCYEVIGVEALVRWIHPQSGLIPPDKFIPLAEDSGLITSLTSFVLNKSLSQLKAWQKQGLHFQLSVNISSPSLTDRSLPDTVSEALREAMIDGAKLMLELTESCVTADVPSNIAAITRMRVKGIEMSIDDFGTGFSSLVQIYRLPFNELKLDRSFVMDIDKHDEAKVIVKAIIELAHTLGLVTCAEGIESATAMTYLSELGCERGQGYFISPPLPPEQLLTWHEGWHASQFNRRNSLRNEAGS